MSALTKMTQVEAKLFLRDARAPATLLGLPLALLLVFGLMPGVNDPDPKYGGRTGLAAVIAPMSVALMLAMLALTMFPNVLATYREKGVLKRLSASPVRPSRLLVAQLLVSLLSAAVVVLLIVGVGRLALHVELPRNLAAFAVSILLGTASLFGLGLLIAAFAPTGRAASGIGGAALFPLMALGGVWVAREQLPPLLGHVADVLPLGATLSSLREAWAGNWPSPLQLGSMVLVAVVCTAFAARFFRWE
ncbi:ABC transporter permease [Amycolatopsis sp. H20-H5]|uniref:ABC transporter permease n=1 Tax=Amycolatopsis sp. H20-H5 TaxID=3046309 RepID=UPI002DBAF517|nr:ABC transporter permease [Amycolatopsis sp. H20-H5]MEC3974144.1 ABC transporter permease [Amycolatopsis sp. H20-H5]